MGHGAQDIGHRQCPVEVGIPESGHMGSWAIVVGGSFRQHCTCVGAWVLLFGMTPISFRWK